jgi:hypothetical protein
MGDFTICMLSNAKSIATGNKKAVHKGRAGPLVLVGQLIATSFYTHIEVS